jgi:hypothetical protein
MVRYWCRRCGALVGTAPGTVDDPRLGLLALTPQERADIIVGNLPADHAEVRVLCEACLPEAPPDLEVGWH